MEAITPRHYAVIDRYNRKLTLTFEGNIIAETKNAMILKEVGRSVSNPVFYIPKEDIKVDLAMEPETTGFCPIKGHANRWHLTEKRTGPYFGWSYEDPLAKAKKIKGHIAFHSGLVTFISAPLAEN